MYIYAHKLFTSKSQTSLSLKARMATFNYFTSLSFILFAESSGVSRTLPTGLWEARE